MLLLVATWIDRYVDEQWAATGGTVGGLGVLIVVALLGIGSEGRRWWGPIALSSAGLVAALIGLAAALSEIWGRGMSEEVVFLLVTVAALAAFVNISSLIRMNAGQSRVRLGTIGVAILATILVNALVFADQQFDDTMLGRASAASMIVTACGAMSFLVFIAINRRSQIERGTTGLAAELVIVCPNCRTKQEVPWAARRARNAACAWTSASRSRAASSATICCTASRQVDVPSAEPRCRMGEWRTIERRPVRRPPRPSRPGARRTSRSRSVPIAQERYAESEPLLRDSVEEAPRFRRAKKLPPAVERLVKLYEAWGKPGEADAWRAKLEALTAEDG